MNTLDNLKYIFANVNEWLKFAEAKNLTLLTINSAIIIGVFQIDFASNVILKDIIFFINVPSLFASGIIALISLSPILAKLQKQNNSTPIINWVANKIDDESVFENIHYYGYLRILSRDTFIKQYQLKTGDYGEFNDFENDLLDQILFNSQITWLKYRLFKFSVFITSISLIIGSLLIIIAKIFGFWE
jgi:hypothetical protein